MNAKPDKLDFCNNTTNIIRNYRSGNAPGIPFDPGDDHLTFNISNKPHFGPIILAEG
jgi:hypothetical protein